MSKILRKELTRLLIETCSTEDFNTDCVVDDTLEVYNRIVSDLDEYEGDIDYDEEMIPVIAHTNEAGTMYVVEYDMLYKLMESYSIDAKEAVERLCEHNELKIGDFYIALEDVTYLEEAGKKIKNNKNDIKSKVDMSNAVKTMQDLQNKGLKLVTKNGKKKKRK